MRRRLGIFRLSWSMRGKVMLSLRAVLEEESDVVFAVVFGSFLDSPVFRDVDLEYTSAGGGGCWIL